MKKRILYIFISILAVFAFFQITSSAESLGACGDNLRCKLENGVLTISGEGEMDDFGSEEPPWEDLDVKSVIIENGVTSIGVHAFYYCRSIESVEIANTVTNIGKGAFAGTSLKEITIPDSVTNIGKELFRQCWSLQNVTLSKNLSYIPNETFYQTGIQDIIIPEGVSMIGCQAFYGTLLLNVTIPQSVMIIAEAAFDLAYYSGWYDADNAFHEYSGLENIYYSGTEKQWNNIDIHENNDDLHNAAIIYQNVKYSNISCGNNAFWNIESNVLKIKGKGAMRDYYPQYPLWFVYDYDAIQIGEGITYIGEWAFDEKIAEIDDNLIDGYYDGQRYSVMKEHVKKISIPQSVKKIKYGAFNTCNLLTDVYYAGTKSEWEQIEISSYNDALLNANIHYNSVMPIVSEPLKVGVTHSISLDNKVLFNITAENNATSNELPYLKLYVAEYGSDGILKNVYQGTNSISGNDSMEITANMPYSNNYKFMLWDSNQTPLMNAVVDIN